MQWLGRGILQSLQALFKFICKCLLMYPMRVCFCSLIHVCLPSYFMLFHFAEICLTTPKYANCPNPAGRKKAVKIVSRFKFSVMHLPMYNTFENLDIKCLSVNIRGLKKSMKRRSVFRWIHNQNVHFTVLQETHSWKLSAVHGQPNGMARFSSAMVQRTAKEY